MKKNDYLSINDNLKIIRRGKKGLWCADFNIGNNHKRVSLKTVDQKTAIEMAEKMSLEIAKGDFKANHGKVVLAFGVESYLKMVQSEGRSKKTYSKYKQVLNQFKGLLEKRGAKYLNQINPTDFDDYRINRKVNKSPKTIYTEAVVIKQFLKFCKSRKLIPENPLAELRLNKPKANKKNAPSLIQVQQILNAMQSSDKIYILTLACSGMRSGELQKLQSQDIDLQGNWIHICSRVGLSTKTGVSRKIPIHPELKKELEAIKKPAGGKWFFPGKSIKHGWMNPQKLNERFVEAAENLGLPAGRENGLTIHSLRHFMETHALNHGVPRRAVDIWLGHTGGKTMSAVYYSLSDDESQNFMKRLPLGFITTHKSGD